MTVKSTWVITEKAKNLSGVISNIDENNVLITWENNKKQKLTSEELDSLLKTNKFEVEEVNEDTPAQDSIRAHSAPDATTQGEADGNPKTRIEYMQAILGDLADMDFESLVKYYDDQQSMIGGEGDRAGLDGKVNFNQNSVRMKPTVAMGESVVKLQKEEQDALFSESTLTEEAKTKFTSLFESAISARLVEEAVKLEEKYNEIMNKNLVDITEGIVDQLDEYCNHVALEWLTENKVAIESSLRSDITKEVMTNLKEFFVQHYVDVPEDSENIVESLVNEVESLKVELNKKINEEIEVQKHVSEMKKKEIVTSVSEGLSLIQKSKFRKLTESVNFSTEEDFKKDILSLKEGLVNKKVDTGIIEEAVTQDDDLQNTDEKKVDPVMQNLLDQMSKFAK